jgi:hypothetical protein
MKAQSICTLAEHNKKMSIFADENNLKNSDVFDLGKELESLSEAASTPRKRLVLLVAQFMNLLGIKKEVFEVLGCSHVNKENEDSVNKENEDSVDNEKIIIEIMDILLDRYDGRVTKFVVLYRALNLNNYKKDLLTEALYRALRILKKHGEFRSLEGDR